MLSRLLTAAGLSAALLLGGCQNPDGSTNWGNTLLLGAGVGTAAALVAGAASDNPRPRRYSGGYGGPRGGYYPAYGGGYGRGGYRGW
ncbi:hypothetical protein [Roseicella aquatilis]|uniref:Lipoprotein n=1 Tax=Roseicella aquatilis TaxID=2527868 RepID=A0A4R4D439_9PROT|nr:hypothetical protein [Roseicella aquatilis]TCZ55019.1 hypothetical protein EXY23_22750 [Roseicella aquatilis]